MMEGLGMEGVTLEVEVGEITHLDSTLTLKFKVKGMKDASLCSYATNSRLRSHAAYFEIGEIRFNDLKKAIAKADRLFQKAATLGTNKIDP
ncbi:MAG: hypothetical protein M3Y08_09225 [Fibrobacterota bacterium]|nr:hypothetical protein [Fibrobacterota bacterium]